MAHLEGAELPESEITAALRRVTLTGQAHPVLCGSSLRYVGVQRLLDAVAAYLPSPLDKPPVTGHHPKKGTEISRKPSPDEPFCGLVFKITSDAHGDLSFVRVYSGRLKSGSRVYNPGKDKKENCSRLYHIRADDREQITEAIAGDIAGIVGLKDSVTGDTLCDAAHPILLERIEFPETVMSMSIEPVSSADKGKLAETLAALAREDPTFTFRVNEETGQTLDLGYGRAASGDPQEPDDPRLQAECPRGQAAGQLSRDDQAGGEAGRGIVHPPDRRLGALCQGLDRRRAGDSAQGGAGAPFRDEAQGGRDSGRVPRRRSRWGCARRPSRAAGPAIRWSI